MLVRLNDCRRSQSLFLMNFIGGLGWYVPGSQRPPWILNVIGCDLFWDLRIGDPLVAQFGQFLGGCNRRQNARYRKSNRILPGFLSVLLASIDLYLKVDGLFRSKRNRPFTFRMDAMGLQVANRKSMDRSSYLAGLIHEICVACQ